jgi:hypothetical protein
MCPSGPNVKVYFQLNNRKRIQGVGMMSHIEEGFFLSFFFFLFLVLKPKKGGFKPKKRGKKTNKMFLFKTLKKIWEVLKKQEKRNQILQPPN